MLKKITVCWNATPHCLVFGYRLLGGASATILRVVEETTLNIAAIWSFETSVVTNNHGLQAGYLSLFILFYFFPWSNTTCWASASSLSRLEYHTHWTHNIRWKSSGRVISPTQRPLPDNTQHSQETDHLASCGIRPRNPSKRAAADQHLISRGHWHRPCFYYCLLLPLDL